MKDNDRLTEKERAELEEFLTMLDTVGAAARDGQNKINRLGERLGIVTTAMEEAHERYQNMIQRNEGSIRRELKK